jgi:hypothetical protein
MAVIGSSLGRRTRDEIRQSLKPGEAWEELKSFNRPERKNKVALRLKRNKLRQKARPTDQARARQKKGIKPCCRSKT